MNPEEIQRQLQTSAQNLSQRYANPPAAPDLANDSQLSALRSQHADKIKQLFAYDTQVAQTTFRPQEAPGPHVEGYTPPEERIIDPMIGQTASSNQTIATAGELGDIMSRIAERKELLSDTYKKGMDVYKMGIEAQKMEFDALSAIFDKAMKIKEFNAAREKEKNEATQKGVLTELYNAMSGIKGTQEKVARAVPEKTGIAQSRAQLSEILKANKGKEIRYDKLPNGQYKYTITSPSTQFVTDEEEKIGKDPAGAARQLSSAAIAQYPEGATEIAKMFDFQFPENKVDQKVKKEQDDVRNLFSGLDDLLSAWKNTGFMDRINPTSSSGIEIGRQKALVGQVLARLVETGRLSDEDRNFYQNQLPQFWMDDNQAMAAIEGVKKGLSGKLPEELLNTGAINTTTTDKPRLLSPDGELREYDSYADPQYLNDVASGFIAQ